MNEAVKKSILEAVRRYDKLAIVRHIRPDGDALGASHGLAGILRATFPEKDIRVLGDDFTEELSFLARDDEPAPDDFYAGALIIAVDTGTRDRISSSKLDLADMIVLIDHHIPDVPYADIAWIEPHRSSTCEMIADLARSFPGELLLPESAARLLYAGIVTDSGCFRFPSVSGETHRLAAMLLDKGIDTESLMAGLFLEKYEYLEYKAYVYRHLQRTPNGVTYLFVTRDMQERFRLSREDASNTVNLMDSIRDSLIWLAFIDNGDGSIRVRLRSRFASVQPLAARFGGGGHEKASGATVRSWEEAGKLVAQADAELKEYKNTHAGWL